MGDRPRFSRPKSFDGDGSPRGTIPKGLASRYRQLRWLATFLCSLLVVAMIGMLLLEHMLRLPLELDAPASSAGLSAYGTANFGTALARNPGASQMSREAQREIELTMKYTVRMNTFRRNDLLKKTVEHYHTCPHVHEIQVVWSDLANEPPDRSYFKLPTSPTNGKDTALANKFPVLGIEPALHFEIHSVDSLNNRFRPILPIETEAVFSVDDDLYIPCSQLDFTHSVWRSAPQAMVGFFPRMHGFDNRQQRFTYHEWWYVWHHGLYSIILTKGCFLHRAFLYEYATIAHTRSAGATRTELPRSLPKTHRRRQRRLDSRGVGMEVQGRGASEAVDARWAANSESGVSRAGTREERSTRREREGQQVHEHKHERREGSTATSEGGSGTGREARADRNFRRRLRDWRRHGGDTDDGSRADSSVSGQGRRLSAVSGLGNETGVSRRVRETDSKRGKGKGKNDRGGKDTRDAKGIVDGTTAYKTTGKTPLPPVGSVMQVIHDYIDDHRNCEDLAMSFVVANITHRPPIWVRGSGVKDIGGSTGLSSNQKAHYNERSECVHYFASLFGGMPLATATQKVRCHIGSRTALIGGT